MEIRGALPELNPQFLRRSLLLLILLLCVSWYPHDRMIRPVPKTLFEITASRSERLVWFRIPKNASRTIVSVLQQSFGEKIDHDPKGIGWTRYAPRRFPGYFSFAFVRNPWARTVSLYFDKVIPGTYLAYRECRGMSFEEFVEWIGRVDILEEDHHLHPQVRFIPPGVTLDFIGRVESLEEDLLRLGLPIEKTPHENSSSHNHYSSYYNERTRAIIERVYAEDIERFCYTFEGVHN